MPAYRLDIFRKVNQDSYDVIRDAQRAAARAEELTNYTPTLIDPRQVKLMLFARTSSFLSTAVNRQAVMAARPKQPDSGAKLPTTGVTLYQSHLNRSSIQLRLDETAHEEDIAFGFRQAFAVAQGKQANDMSGILALTIGTVSAPVLQPSQACELAQMEDRTVLFNQIEADSYRPAQRER